MSTAGIESVEYVFPGEPVQITDWAASVGMSEADADSLIDNGCRFFHRASGMSVMDLASLACRQLAASACFPEPRKIGFIIHCATQQWSMPAPPDSIPARIRAELGCIDAISFSVGQLNCTSAIAALRIACGLLEQSDQFDYAIMVTVDKVIGEQYRNRGFAAIQSDAAAAILLRRGCSKNRILSSAIFRVRGMGESSDFSPALLARMRYTEFWATVSVIRKAAAQAGVPLCAIKRLIPPNTDFRAWEGISRALGHPADFAYVCNIGRRGHACCADPFINLADSGMLDLHENDIVTACTLSNVGAYGAFMLAGSSEAKSRS